MPRGATPTLPRRSKLTVKQKNEIAARRASGERATDLGQEYGVHPGYIRKIAEMYGPERVTSQSFAWVARQEMYRGGAA